MITKKLSTTFSSALCFFLVCVHPSGRRLAASSYPTRFPLLCVFFLSVFILVGLGSQLLDG
jgi:hypothetical protein